MLASPAALAALGRAVSFLRAPSGPHLARAHALRAVAGNGRIVGVDLLFLLNGHDERSRRADIRPLAELRLALLRATLVERIDSAAVLNVGRLPCAGGQTLERRNPERFGQVVQAAKVPLDNAHAAAS